MDIIRTDFPRLEQDPKDAFTPEGRTDLQNQAWDYMKIIELETAM